MAISRNVGQGNRALVAPLSRLVLLNRDEALGITVREWPQNDAARHAEDRRRGGDSRRERGRYEGRREWIADNLPCGVAERADGASYGVSHCQEA